MLCDAEAVDFFSGLAEKIKDVFSAVHESAVYSPAGNDDSGFAAES